MPGIGNQYLSLADYYRRQDPDNSVADVIEMLSDINPILEDAIAIECNDGSSHLTTMRTGLPQGTWRKLYSGVQPSKSTTAQVKDTTGWLEAYSELDKKLFKLAGGNGAALRLDEAESFIEGMSNQMATAMFYSDDAATPEQFMGLAPRFSEISDKGTGKQIHDAGGTGSDNTSIWFMDWSPKTVSLLYPKGTMAGIQRQDLGETTKELTDGSMYQVMREHFQWDVGLTLRDYRHVARCANVDVSEMRNSMTSGGDHIEKHLIQTYYKMRKRRGKRQEAGKSAIYCNTEVKTALHLRAAEKGNVNLSISEFEGREIVTFLGIPIRECDALISTEAPVEAA